MAELKLGENVDLWPDENEPGMVRLLVDGRDHKLCVYEAKDLLAALGFATVEAEIMEFDARDERDALITTAGG